VTLRERCRTSLQKLFKIRPRRGAFSDKTITSLKNRFSCLLKKPDVFSHGLASSEKSLACTSFVLVTNVKAHYHLISFDS